ncbi:NfeD family protein [Aestuariibius sp. HNIBRBA575]|uniref:NfeD family protein n=1 Tax=Aestuariibius sp. HNIBRBA575 TaxID=3233343 RepID=UPI0034A3CC85
MELWQEWWTWMVAGLVLGILEVLAPGYIFLGFAAGAVGVGILTMFGLSGVSFPMVLVIFAVFSLLSFLLLRRFLSGSTTDVKIVKDDIND